MTACFRWARAAPSFPVLSRGPVLSEPSPGPGPLLPQDDSSDWDKGKGVMRLHCVLCSVGMILGLGAEQGILRW